MATNFMVHVVLGGLLSARLRAVEDGEEQQRV